ncbi:hypothetical protein [Anoxybacillus sp.]|uniref:hypothetical protein n=1 Tax=Anoxybacillus sp. TaxID=1872573 RepID=UPI002633E994|nr:hypothetical protein [uncultured Anoxybacillus sp.]
MKRKITRLGVMCLTLVALLSPEIGQARDTDYTTGADFSWSPYIWSLGAYRSSSDSSQVVGYLNNVKFDSEAVAIHKRQLFSGVKSISSKASGSGTWTQTGYNAELIDGGRTYVITVSGKYSYHGATYTISTSIEFYCNATRGAR